MEKFNVTKEERGFQLEGFPDAVKIIRLEGSKSIRLADLALHKIDLEFAAACLQTINTVPENQRVLRRSLWHSAIVHFMKCFGNSESRFSLTWKVVYKNEPGSKDPFEYFKSLRNKHLIHDENSYAQSLPGAVLNKEGMDHKIAKIICFSAIGETLEQSNFSNLDLLIKHALVWVESQFDALCDSFTTELEAMDYAELAFKADVKYSVPKQGDVHKAR